ncbi:protein kinase [Streptomyces sp. NPDC059479]|uniref:protein kinase domain-containing protein n=1 Tax=Streptomyces sp. NPDC059479 TaxID=3346848 RepID=UPI0036983B35
MRQEAQPEHVIGGRYRLIDRLGSGGFGRVWRARDQVLCVDVAVKEVWLPPTASDAEHAERLVRAAREARNAARLRDHPGIVAVHDVVVEDDVPWIVMRLVEGRSLADHLHTRGPLHPDDVARIAWSLLDALSAAHSVGIAHRDVKPANVMLADGGEVLLTDFGIAVHQADTALTAPGGFIGSLPYLAPERARGQRGNAGSDLFSLGVTLYEATEGFSPFCRDSPPGSLAAILFEPAPPPQRAGRLEPLITGLLEKEPRQRLTTSQALALVSPPPKIAGPAFPDPERPSVEWPAQKLADDPRVDLSSLKGTGDGGKNREQGVHVTVAPEPAAGRAATAEYHRLTVGDRCPGVVARIVSFGVFISLPSGQEGLLHISELRRNFGVREAEEAVSIGDQLHVEIAEIDRRGKIGLKCARSTGARAPGR